MTVRTSVFLKDQDTYVKKGRTKVIYKGTFVSKQSLKEHGLKKHGLKKHGLKRWSKNMVTRNTLLKSS